MGLQASLISKWLIACAFSTCCSVHVQLSDVHQPFAKVLQDAKVIHYLGCARSQLPELLQLQAVEFYYYLWAAKLLIGLNEQFTRQYGFTKSSFLN
jgi:hypothetical protein